MEDCLQLKAPFSDLVLLMSHLVLGLTERGYEIPLQCHFWKSSTADLAASPRFIGVSNKERSYSIRIQTRRPTKSRREVSQNRGIVSLQVPARPSKDTTFKNHWTGTLPIRRRFPLLSQPNLCTSIPYPYCRLSYRQGNGLSLASELLLPLVVPWLAERL